MRSLVCSASARYCHRATTVGAGRRRKLSSSSTIPSSSLLGGGARGIITTSVFRRILQGRSSIADNRRHHLTFGGLKCVLPRSSTTGSYVGGWNHRIRLGYDGCVGESFRPRPASISTSFAGDDGDGGRSSSSPFLLGAGRCTIGGMSDGSSTRNRRGSRQMLSAAFSSSSSTFIDPIEDDDDDEHWYHNDDDDEQQRFNRRSNNETTTEASSSSLWGQQRQASASSSPSSAADATGMGFSPPRHEHDVLAAAPASMHQPPRSGRRRRGAEMKMGDALECIIVMEEEEEAIAEGVEESSAQQQRHLPSTSGKKGMGERRKKISEIPISEVLDAKHRGDTSRRRVMGEGEYMEPTVHRRDTVRHVISRCIDGGLSGMMVLDDDRMDDPPSSSSTVDDDGDGTTTPRRRGRVVGMITSRDLLRILAAGLTGITALGRSRGGANASSGDGMIAGSSSSNDHRHHNHHTDSPVLSPQEVLSQEIGNFMTPLRKVVYAKPHETIGTARSVMAKMGIKCLPILSISGGAKVEGLITRRDVSEFGLNASDRGGKKNFLNDVSSRTGLCPTGAHSIMGDRLERASTASSSSSSVGDYSPPSGRGQGDGSVKPAASTAAADATATATTRGAGVLMREELAWKQSRPLTMAVGVSALPHPHKGGDCTPAEKREENIEDDAGEEDKDDVSEDAHFVMNIRMTQQQPSGSSEEMERGLVKSDGNSNHNNDVVFLGVADGVGSWREYGVDPRRFSRTLVGHCQEILREEEISISRTPSSSSSSRHPRRRLPTPTELIAEAFERTKTEEVVGSSTICVGMFDKQRHMFHFSNLGDCGVVVLRHIDSDVAGALRRNRRVKRENRTSDLRVAFVSEQQLQSFNFPYQLGWVPPPASASASSGPAAIDDANSSSSSSFHSPVDCSETSLHLQRGDIVVMATDGLYDNVDLDDIVKVALEWERTHGFPPPPPPPLPPLPPVDIDADSDDGGTEEDMEFQRDQLRQAALSSSVEHNSLVSVPELSRALCQEARDRSLDRTIDSPFAVLAKENDIMWSGGMPDDCTVIVLHVV